MSRSAEYGASRPCRRDKAGVIPSPFPLPGGERVYVLFPLPLGERIKVRGGNHSTALHIPNSKGFTLIEVLLSLAILALISTVTYMSFSSSGEHVEQAEAARDDVDLARTLIARMSDDIANAFCKPGMKSGVFFGLKEEVETSEGQRRIDSIFVSTLTNSRRPGSKESDLWVVGYRFKEKPDGGGYRLMRYERRDLSFGTAPMEGGEEDVLTVSRRLEMAGRLGFEQPLYASQRG